MDLQLPRLADTLVEGTVSRWLKRPGERVSRGEPVVEVETDKVNTELEAPADGVLVEVLVDEGETAAVGQVLARIGAPGEAPEAEREELTAATPATEQPAQVQSPTRTARLAENIRRAAAAIPQGACVREVPAGALPRLEEVARDAAGDLALVILPPSRAHLAMPPLRGGQPALLVPGAERQGRRMLALCYDRRALDDWSADRLLGRIAAALEEPAGR